eukprot:TRINITY_DN139_c0_g1_i1.p1 TRINITY_DN139_c0_g1~~TRINITY_DN139_c0_g1_i1.p1  ORF type:complete len:161 (+),score=58.52 TRINITY_DN139_c0_g1_i1:133-615(+)
MKSLEVFLTLLVTITAFDSYYQPDFMQNIMAARNVLGKPLQKCSTSPVTGYMRDGYCRADPTDGGRHTLSGIVSQKFLDFSKKRGNDLMTPHPPSFPGLKEGDRWCLCVSRWVEAYEARNEEGEEVVPKVVLESTEESTLKSVKLDVLKKYAVDIEAANS